MSQELTTKEKYDEYKTLRNNLSEPQFMEFIRKAGLPEQRLQELIPNDSVNKLDHVTVLDAWVMQFGHLDKNTIKILTDVKKEVFNAHRNLDVDTKLSTSLGSSRDIAWLLYPVVQRYYLEQEWRDIARYKLGLDTHVIDGCMKDHSGNKQEQCYQMLLRWVHKSDFKEESATEIAKALHELGIIVPRPYLDRIGASTEE